MMMMTIKPKKPPLSANSPSMKLLTFAATET